MKFLLKVLATISVTMLIFNHIQTTVVSAEKSLSIDVLPKEVLFDVNNMRPGDWAPRTTTIKNTGDIAFDYNLVIEPQSETLKLYNELLLEVVKEEKELYNGKLSKFPGLSSHNLKPGEEDHLELTVRFPEHLGNDFQGLDARFTIYINAESSEINKSGIEVIKGSIDSGDGDSTGEILPKTATNLFNILLIGSILISLGIIFLIFKGYRKNFTRDL